MIIKSQNIMNYPILVTAAIIENNGKYLITQRPDDGRHNANRWEFPGGKVNFGEEPRYCLEREILEKIDIKSYAWITPNEMGNYDICEADLPFIKKLKKM